MGGNDQIFGQDGSDFLYGGDELNSNGSGDDTIDGKAGDDQIFGADGADDLKGGTGKDTIYGGSGQDVILGEADDDIIYGEADNDNINGGLGADTIYAGAGDDVITFEQADNKVDIVYGGDDTADSGNDTVDYTQAIKGMTVTLEDGNAKGEASSADQGTDELYGIENIIGSNLEADNIRGNNVTNTLNGMGGDDTLYGEEGADTLFGGADNDKLYGGIGADSIDGESGNDVIYGDDGADNLVGNTGDDTFFATNASDGIDSIIGGTGSDTVDYSVITDGANGVTATLLATGDSTVDLITGDDDTINGIENIVGTSGNDTFTGSALVNSLEGGAGTDEVRYDYDNGAGVTVNLEARTATENGGIVDSLTTIENVVGSSYDDSFITQSGVSNVINGGIANTNEINGDTIDYSSRNNSLDVTLNGATLATVNVTGDSNDQIQNIENVTGSTSNDTITGDGLVNTLLGMAGNDTLSGQGGADYIDGGAGDDQITGGAGADNLFGSAGDDTFDGTDFTGDVIDGGDEVDSSRGSDTVDYSSLSVSTSGVNVTLNDDTVANVTVDGSANNHTIVNVENVIGTSLVDSIFGDADTNSLIGNAGNDYIDGGAGNDYIEGGANATGTETLIGGLGLDTIYGGTGVDYILGGDDADLLYGEDEDDTLDGGAGVDTLRGGAGNDTLIGGADNDNLVGGGGSDTADYSTESSSVQANIANSFAVGSSIGTDTFNSIENITGTDLGGESDNITGNDSANTLRGLGGDDTISEMAGDDLVEGGEGNDYIIAGAGDDTINGDGGTVNGTADTLDYNSIAINDDTGDTRDADGTGSDTSGSDAYLGVEVDLSITASQRIHNEYGSDTITNIENVIGSDKGDYLSGNSADNTLEGRAGNDYLVGLEGADRLIGGSGTDTVDFSASSSTVIVDMTKSQTDGSSGTYRIENDGYGNAEYLDGIENIITGDGADTIYGDALSNTIITGVGNDTIRGGADADVIDGGADEDTADFSDLAFGITLDLDSDDNGANDAEGTALSNGKTDVLRQIENVIGTDRADNITGDDKDNTLFGGADNDSFKGLQGVDYIDGGAGTADTIDFSDGTQGIKVDLTSTQTLGNTATYRVQDDGFANAEYIDGIENIIGTSSVDTITGDDNNNLLDGGASGDTISGGVGSDILLGKAGADTFSGGAGDDYIYGNIQSVLEADNDSDRDVVDYSSASNSILLNLSSSDSTIELSGETSTTFGTQTAVGEGTDRLYDIQDVIGSNLADTLVGDENVNSLLGNGGNDILIGGLGADVLLGQGDNDTILGGLDSDVIYGGSLSGVTHTDSGNDTVDYSYITDGTAIDADLSRDDSDSDTNNEQEIRVVGTPTSYDSLEGIENVIGTRNNDIIKGSDDFSEVNILDGYSGNDTFIASQGVDSFLGGDGTDTLDFSNIDVNNVGENRVIVDLGLGQATDDGYQNGGAVVDTISDIEIVIGTNGDDQLRGSSENNTLTGGAGDDTINGVDGTNLLQGGDDNDSIYGGIGVDTLEGGIGNDVLQGGDNNDILTAGDGDDILEQLQGAGNDTIDAGAGNDTIYSGEGDNRITGGDDSDTLTYEQVTTSGINANLGSGAGGDFGTVTIGSNTDTLLDHVEIIRGSTESDEILGFNGTAEIGIDYSDTLYGRGSGDSIYGGIGDDTIYGEGGQDTIRGQAGDDVIDGGSSNDTIDFADATTGVRVYLDSTDENNVATTHEVMEDGFGDQDQLTSIERVFGSSFDDTIKGTNTWNYINSGAGDDTIIATNGGDTIDGGSHNAGAGGGDWLSFQALGTAVNATMNSGTITGGLGTTTISNIENLLGTTLNDTLTGDSNDNSLDGNDGNDTLNGGEGNDFLLGNVGDDTLSGGDGVDTYDGGTGEDTIDFYDITSSVDVDLSTSTVNDDGFGRTESGSISNIENIRGTLTENDVLTGDNNDNVIYGFGGNDVINGLGGFDTIYGGTGSDTINTGTDADNTSEDVVFGEEGIDTITGNFDRAVIFGDTVGGGNVEEDWIDYSTSTSGITVDLGQNITDATYTLDSANDTLDGTYVRVTNNDTPTDFDLISQIENIIGTNQVDVLGGNAGEDNSILAGDGDDTIFHSSAVGNNYVDGQAGSDWLNLEYYSVNIDLNSTTNGIYNIENVEDRQVGSSRTIWGSTTDNTFIMYDGNDRVLGREGNDVYDLGSGNDMADAGYGNDTIIAGSGTDTLNYRSYFGSSQGIELILQNANIDTDNDKVGDLNVSTTVSSQTVSGLNTLADGSYNFFEITDSRGFTDYLYQEGDGSSDFENFYLGTLADTMVADDGANYIEAYEGDDIVLGMGGADRIDGETGNDILYGGDGNDIINGENDDDTLYGDDGIDVVNGGSGNDYIEGGADGDSLYGGTGNDTIYTGTGDDIVNGNEGLDVIYNEDGADTIDGGDEVDLLNFVGGTQGVNVRLDGTVGGSTDSYGRTETITNIENVNGTGFNDIFRGSSSENTITGAAGDDTIYVTEGDDKIQGDSGSEDLLDFSEITIDGTANDSTIDNFVDLNSQDNAVFSVGTVAYNQSLSGLENVRGSSKDDQIIGTDTGDVDNTIEGLAGNDSIEGLSGDDYLAGGDGDDIIEGGVGNDTLYGGNDTTDTSTNDTVVFDSSVTGVEVNIGTTLQGGIAANSSTGEGTDSLFGFENVTGSSSADTIYGSSIKNIISGGASADFLYGLDGDDTLNGNGGDDYIDGGIGNDDLRGNGGDDTFITSVGDDTIDGGGASDTVDYSSATGTLNITLLDSGTTNITIDGNDSLTNIENLTGTSQNDNITGESNDNTFIGNAGNDTLTGAGGDDDLQGGTGDDRIFAGSGVDTIDGGEGSETTGDWLDYSDSSANITVSLRDGTASGDGNDTISNIEHIQMGNGTNTVEGDVFNNSLIGGTGTDTLDVSATSSGATINITDVANGNGTTSGTDIGTDNFENFEGFIGSSQSDTLNTTDVGGITFNAAGSVDRVNYNVTDSSALTVTIDGTNPETVSDGTNTDNLSNVEIIQTGNGGDTFNLSSTSGVDTLDAGAGNDTLSLSGTLDLSSVTLLNFENISIADGDTATLNATDLDNQNMTINMVGSGSLVIVATSNPADHDFDNISITKGTGTVILQVDNTVNLVGRDINGSSSDIIDIIEVNSGATVTLSETQVTSGTVVVNGAGSAVVQVSANSSADYSSILALDTASNETVQFTADSTFTGDFGNSNILVDSGVTLSTAFSTLNGKTSVLSGAGNITLTDSNVAASDVDDVAAAISGTLTATITTGAISSTLAAIGNVNVSDNITFTTNDTTGVDASDLVDLNALVDTPDYSSITGIVEAFNTANVATEVTNALSLLDGTETVDITGGAISAADVNSIAGATSGAVTATITTGAVTATLGAIGNVNGTDNITFTTNDTNVDASDLVALNALVDTFNVSSITTIEETAGNPTAITNALGIVSNAAVTISGSESVANANTVDAATTGVVTTTITETDATTLATLTDANGNNVYTATINTSSVDASVFNSIANVVDNLTDGGVTTLTEDAASFAQVNTALTGGVLGGNEAVTISGNISATDVDTVLGNTTGVVTATVSSNTAANLNSDLSNASATDALSLTVTNTPTDAADLVSLNGKTNQVIDVTAIASTINGDSSELIDIYVTNNAQYNGLGNEAVTVDNIASAADVNSIAGATSGAVTATITTGAVTATLGAIGNVNGTDNITFTTNDTNVDASDLVALNALVDTFNVSSITTIEETAGNPTAITNALGIVTNAAVTISGSESVANANTVDAATTGVVTTTITETDATTLATLTDANGNNVYTATINTSSVDASVFNSIANVVDNLTDGGVTTLTEDAASFAQVNTALTGGVLGGNEAVTISGNISATDVDTVLGNTTGVVTATVSSNTAANLNSDLSNASATDALSLTVTNTPTDAADLVSLNGKTNQVIDVTAIASTINGDSSELIDIYVTNNAQYNGLGNEAVTVDNTASATDVNSIAGATSGAVTATITTGAVTATLGAIGNVNGTDNITFTTNDTNVDASDLVALNALVDTFNVSSITTIEETAGNPTAITNALGIVANAAVTISGSESASNVNTTLGNTTGTVTATVNSATAADLNSNLSNASATDALTLTTSGTSATAANLLALDAKTSVTVNASSITTITGTSAEISSLISADVTLASNYNVTISDAITASSLNTILSDTTGVVTATVSSDTVANLNSNLSNATASDALSLTTSGTSATAANLNSLDGKTSVAINAASLTDIDGTLSDLNTTYNSSGISGLGNENVSITNTGTVTASDMNDLLSPLETSGTITLSGAGSLNITLSAGEDIDLSGVTNSLSGSLTIVDSSGGNSITGTSSAETVETTVSNLTASDNINGSGGNDTLTFTNSGSIDSDDIVDGVSGFETLNLSSGNDTVSFDNVADFDNFRSEFTTINETGGNDTLSFGTTAISGDLDFTGLSNFENLDLSSVADTITLSGDETGNVNGLTGDDNFTLDFSNIDNFVIDGGAGTADEVDLTGTTNDIGATNTNFGHINSFDNIESLDFSALTLDTQNPNVEFELDESLIEAWTDGNNDLTLKLLNSSQADRISFTDKDGNVYDGEANSVTDGATYQIDNDGTTLTIDLIS